MTVERASYGEAIADRVLTPAAGQTYDFIVQRWADLGTITGSVTSFNYSSFLGARRVFGPSVSVAVQP